MHVWRIASPWELWVHPYRKELCPRSGGQELRLPRTVNNTILKKYVWAPACSCEAQGKLHMLLDFYLMLSDRVCWGSTQAAVDGAGTIPAHSCVWTQLLFHKSDFQQHCSHHQVCDEATLISALVDLLVDFYSISMNDTLWISNHPTRTALENQGQRKGTFSITSAVAEMNQRELSDGNISWASPPHPAHASCKRKDRAERTKITWLRFSPDDFSSAYWQAPRRAADRHLRSRSQTPFAEGAWQGRPAGGFCFLTVSPNANEPQSFRVAKDDDGASFPLLDETSGRANWCCIMHISNCSSSALAFWSTALSSCLGDQPLLYINL